MKWKACCCLSQKELYCRPSQCCFCCITVRKKQTDRQTGWFSKYSPDHCIVTVFFWSSVMLFYNRCTLFPSKIPITILNFCVFVVVFCSRYSDWLEAVRPRVRNSSPDRARNFLLSISFTPVLGPTQPATHGIWGYYADGKGAHGSVVIKALC
jgi:hypothetical protein